MQKIYTSILTLVLCLKSGIFYGQKIGLVLSGGGADALAHIGVLKAMEEEGIIPDCIAGSSVGALIGAFYASGYTPEEIEKIVKTNNFQYAAQGKINFLNGYFFKARESGASWLTIRFDPTRSIIKNLPVNVINSIPIEYYLMEKFSFPSIASRHCFDSLFVPFRCTAADITQKKNIVFPRGPLSVAVRASMSYPFYLRPFSWNGFLLYDGGLYENFPLLTMNHEFSPDVIIGSDVSEKQKKPEEDDLYSQIRNLITNNKDSFGIHFPDTFVVRSYPEVGLLGFSLAQKAIDSGYAAAKRFFTRIRPRLNPNWEVFYRKQEKRKAFRAKAERIDQRIQYIHIHKNLGKAELYVRKSVGPPQDLPLTMNQVKKRFFRLAADDRLKSVLPVIEMDTATEKNAMHLYVKKEKPFYLDVGALVSNRPVSFVFSALEYHRLGKIGFKAYANGYLGKLMSGGMAKLKFDFPGKIPVCIEPHASYSRWDYFSTSLAFLDLKIPPFLIQEDQYAGINAVIPAGNLSILNFKGGWASWNYYYYQVENFKKLDTLDKTYFPHLYAQTHFELNTLNRKMYPNEGFLFKVGAKYLEGNEKFYPGNISPTPDTIHRIFHHWYQFFSKAEVYLKPFKFFRLGFYGDVVYGSQSFFSNYYASILASPVFEPIPELKTFFYEKYRAHSFFSLGGKIITIPFKNIEFRGELYYFQPFLTIVRNKINPYLPNYSLPLLNQYLIASAFLIYQSPLGPLSLSLNYVDRKELVTVFFHFGYLIFNKKSSEF